MARSNGKSTFEIGPRRRYRRFDWYSTPRTKGIFQIFLLLSSEYHYHFFVLLNLIWLNHGNRSFITRSSNTNVKWSNWLNYPTSWYPATRMMTQAGQSVPTITSINATQFSIRGISSFFIDWEKTTTSYFYFFLLSKIKNSIQFPLFWQSERKRTGLKCGYELAAQFRPITGQVHGLAIGHGIGTGIARTGAGQLRTGCQDVSRTRPDAAQGRNSSHHIRISK